MDFQYTEEQQLLADSVARLADQHYDFEARKRVIASTAGHSPEAWRQLAELGLTALTLPGSQGGFDGGALDLVATMETLGNALMLEPFVSTVGLGARLIAALGSEVQKQSLLPAVAEGSLILALAHAEPDSRHDISQVSTRASAQSGGWRITGAKSLALDAPIAGKLIVSARSSGEASDPEGVSLFLVDANAPGLQMRTLRTQDNRRAADIELNAVQVPAEALLGRAGAATAALVEAIDFATALYCAEAVGAMRFANQSTLEYLKTRRQFGVPIGSFQALQHRLVDMFVSAEQARSITLLACSRVDAAARGEIDVRERMRTVSAAKVKVSEAARHVGQEAIQLHGGMGMTQEMKIAHTFKRLTMIAQTMGDVDWHLERFAATDLPPA
ncbi:MAG: acyl-CoA dehydrogenase family protein [Betaproteobacteria bacterium]